MSTIGNCHKPQYKLRSLMVAVTLLSLFLGLVAWEIRAEEEAKTARAYYERLGTFHLDVVGDSLTAPGQRRF
jgi:hypothetical protein